MYYSAGNYEAFAHPEKPEGAEKKSAYIIGSGLAGLSAAFYLVRDAQLKGEHIHILERLPVSGGSCDGNQWADKGFYMRGGREMDNHFECMWDLYRDVPSLEDPKVSVLMSIIGSTSMTRTIRLCRATEKRGQDAHTDGKFTLDDKAQKEVMKLFFTGDRRSRRQEDQRFLR
jgi:oleate hydratase